MKNYITDNLICLILQSLICIFFLPPVSFSGNREKWEKPLKLCREFQLDKSYTKILASDNDSELETQISKNNIVLFSENSLSIYDPRENTLIWEIDTFKINFITFDPEKNMIFLLLEKSEEKINEKFIQSIDVKSGITNWSIEFDYSINKILLENELLYVSQDNKIQIINSKTGKFEKNILLNHKISDIWISEKTIFVKNSNNNNEILLLSSDNNEIRSQIEFPFEILEIKRIKHDIFFLLNDKNEVVFYNFVARKIIWSRKVGGRITGILYHNDSIYVSSLDNFVYFIDLKGRLLSKKRLEGRITDSPAIMREKVATFTYNSNLVSIFDFKSFKMINQISLSDASFVQSVRLSDDNLYILDQNSIKSYSPECK